MKSQEKMKKGTDLSKIKKIKTYKSRVFTSTNTRRISVLAINLDKIDLLIDMSGSYSGRIELHTPFIDSENIKGSYYTLLTLKDEFTKAFNHFELEKKKIKTYESKVYISTDTLDLSVLSIYLDKSKLIIRIVDGQFSAIELYEHLKGKKNIESVHHMLFTLKDEFTKAFNHFESELKRLDISVLEAVI